MNRNLAATVLCLAMVASIGTTSLHSQIYEGRIVEHPLTEAGVWDGTWYYKTRDAMFAVWMRTVGGQPEIKVQYLSSATLESFGTEWGEPVDYTLKSGAGRFSVEIVEADANQIRADWQWELRMGRGSRIETADLRIFRSGNGRALIMRFDNFERTVRRGDKEQVLRVPQSWTLRKASKRQLLWDEIPF